LLARECRPLSIGTAALALLAAVPAAGASALAPHSDSVTVGPGGGTPGTSENFTLVGHDPLFNRGMNAAATIYTHYIYIGNRTDAPRPAVSVTRGAPVPIALTRIRAC
jgi:hypothetical protein